MPLRKAGLACRVSSGRRPETRQARLAQVRDVVLGLLPEPWNRKGRPPRGEG